MPLDGVAQQWAAFAGTFFTYPAFSVTTAVFSALASETHALQQYDHACFRRLNGQDGLARTATEQAVHDLHDASAQWMSVLWWLEQLASDVRHPLDTEEQATLRAFLVDATTHLQRVGGLTQQVQAAWVLSYQQHGIGLRQRFHQDEKDSLCQAFLGAIWSEEKNQCK
jgi:hypothetical protein